MSNHLEKYIAGESMIKGTKSLFRLGKDTVLGGIESRFRLGRDTVLRSIKGLFGLEKDKALGYIRSYFQLKEKGDKEINHEVFEPEEDCYKPIRIGNVFGTNYIECKSNGDKDKTLSAKYYLDMIRPYLNDLIDNYKTQGE